MLLFVNKSSNVNFVVLKRFLNFLLFMKVTIDRLQSKLELLVSKHQEVKSANLQIKDNFLSLQKQLEKEQQTVLELKEKNKILKLSASLQGEEQDTQAAGQRINDLVREIDKCIALLNK